MACDTGQKRGSHAAGGGAQCRHTTARHRYVETHVGTDAAGNVSPAVGHRPAHSVREHSVAACDRDATGTAVKIDHNWHGAGTRDQKPAGPKPRPRWALPDPDSGRPGSLRLPVRIGGGYWRVKVEASLLETGLPGAVS